MTCHAGGWLLRVCTGLLSHHLSQPRLQDDAPPSKSRRLDDSSSDTEARVAKTRAAEARPKPSSSAPWSTPRPLPPPPSKAPDTRSKDSGSPKAAVPVKAPAVDPKLPVMRGKQHIRHNTGKYANRGGKNKQMFNAKYNGVQELLPRSPHAASASAGIEWQRRMSRRRDRVTLERKRNMITIACYRLSDLHRSTLR